MNIRHKWRTGLSAIVAVALLGASLAMAGITNTKHNLSVTGPGTYKATSETQICVYCHTPHNANPASLLWNHTLSTVTYQPYSSNTMKAAAPGQPSGASKLCLTCHDGTVALGSVLNLPRQHQQPGTIAGLASALLGTAPTNLSTDLRNDHPVSFTYDSTLASQNTELNNPAAITGKIKPGISNLMQCNNCHDPHSDANPKFMLAPYQDASGYGSPLCRTCHNKEYYSTLPNMTHRESTKQWNGVGANPWYIPGQNLPLNANSTIKTNGCENCHQPHNSPSTQQLLKSGGGAATCLTCHNGNVVADPAKNIDLALSRPYVHPIKDATRAGRHKPKRQADGKVREDPADLANRHAECEDCHNPHAVSPGVSPNAAVGVVTNNLTAPVNKGVWGVTPTWPANWTDVTTYTTVQDTTYQYQICLKCHSYYAYGLTPPIDPYNKMPSADKRLTDQAKEFNPNNASIHPVTGPGKNPFTMTVGVTNYSYASSLINGMTPTSTYGCSECHSNGDSGAGIGPKGPHGSNTWPIVWGLYNDQTGRVGTTTGATAHICFKCHDANVYASLTSRTAWQKTGFSNGAINIHVYHVVTKNVACNACHAGVPHGWKRKRMLIFGATNLTRDPGADVAPYNAHLYYPWDGISDYGIPSNVGSFRGKTLDTITSGNWQQDDCHNGVPNISVGSCG